MSTTANSGLKHLTQRRAIDAALGNEQITRERVTRLEAQVKADVEWGKGVGALLSRGFWGRLKWLATGR